jgi:hypothetical protein
MGSTAAVAVLSLSRFGIRDLFVAIPEDLIAIGLALFLVCR